MNEQELTTGLELLVFLDILLSQFSEIKLKELLLVLGLQDEQVLNEVEGLINILVVNNLLSNFQDILDTLLIIISHEIE